MNSAPSFRAVNLMTDTRLPGCEMRESKGASSASNSQWLWRVGGFNLSEYVALGIRTGLSTLGEFQILFRSSGVISPRTPLRLARFVKSRKLVQLLSVNDAQTRFGLLDVYDTDASKTA